MRPDWECSKPGAKQTTCFSLVITYGSCHGNINKEVVMAILPLRFVPPFFSLCFSPSNSWPKCLFVYLLFCHYANKINKPVRKAGSVVGINLDNLEAVAEERTRRKLDAILRNPSHPLYDELQQMGSTFSQTDPSSAHHKAPWPVLCASSHQAPQPNIKTFI